MLAMVLARHGCPEAWLGLGLGLGFPTLTLTPSLTLSLTLTRFLEALLEDTLPPPLAALPRDLAELPPTAAPAAGNPSPNPQLIPTPTPNLTFSNLLT